MTTIAQVIQAAIPGADEQTCDHILWSRTPFPMGRITARSLFKAASGTRRAAANNIVLCDHCDNRVTDHKWECNACHDGLMSHREAS
jgi:hypothetical protein